MATALFSVNAVHLDGQAVVRFIGELDLAGAELAQHDGLRALASTDGGPLILDLSELSFCDSSGLGVLLRIQYEARQQGRALVLQNPNPAVQRLLEIVGLDERFTIEGSERSAPTS